MPDSLDVEDLRKSARAAHEKSVIRLQDELEKMIKLCSFARESLETELFSGLGYKQTGLLDKDLKKLKDLATTFGSAVDAKIRFDKAAKQLATSMTPAEERGAVVTYLASLDYDGKHAVLQACFDKGIWTGVNFDRKH